MSEKTDMYLNKKDVYLNTSDIASYIGQNKWDFITPFERLWKKIDPDYNILLNATKKEIEIENNKIINLENNKKQLELELQSKNITKDEYLQKSNEIINKKDQLTSQIEKLQTKVDDIHLTREEKLKKVLNDTSMDQIKSDKIDTDEKKKIFQETLEKNIKLSKEQKEILQKTGESFINTTHGTLKENDAIGMYENKFKVKLDTSQKFYKKKLDFIQNTNYNWYICGKVDGLYTDETNPKNNYIVEVKNRTKSFFSTLRDYEKTQIQLYMWMLNIPQSRLVEKLNNKIRITKIFYDDEYINLLQKSLQIFSQSVESKFLSNYTEKYNYILKTEEEKKIYLNKLYISPVVEYINNYMMDSDLDEKESKNECDI